MQIIATLELGNLLLHSAFAHAASLGEHLRRRKAFANIVGVICQRDQDKLRRRRQFRLPCQIEHVVAHCVAAIASIKITAASRTATGAQEGSRIVIKPRRGRSTRQEQLHRIYGKP